MRQPCTSFIQLNKRCSITKFTIRRVWIFLNNSMIPIWVSIFLRGLWALQ